MTLIDDLQVLFSLLLTKYKEDVDSGSIQDINNPWNSNYRTICNEWAKDIDRESIDLKQISLIKHDSRLKCISFKFTKSKVDTGEENEDVFVE